MFCTLLRTARANALQAISEQPNARPDGVPDSAKFLKTLGSRAARGRRVGQLPAELESAARRDRAARITDRNDDVPTLAHRVDGLARVLRDVDADLTHRRDR